MVPLIWCWYKYCAYAEFPRCFKRNPNYYPRQKSREMHLLQSSKHPPLPPNPQSRSNYYQLEHESLSHFIKNQLLILSPCSIISRVYFYFHRYFLLQDRASSAHAHLTTTYPIPAVKPTQPHHHTSTSKISPNPRLSHTYLLPFLVKVWLIHDRFDSVCSRR